MKEEAPYENPGSDRQWWLTEGSEICSACEAAVHPETLGFCVVCDRGVCTLCVDHSVTGGPVLCPACAEHYWRDGDRGKV